jgi:hypothetical protein
VFHLDITFPVVTMPEMTPFNHAITRDLKIDKIGLVFTVFDKTALVPF